MSLQLLENHTALSWGQQAQTPSTPSGEGWKQLHLAAQQVDREEERNLEEQKAPADKSSHPDCLGTACLKQYAGTYSQGNGKHRGVTVHVVLDFLVARYFYFNDTNKTQMPGKTASAFEKLTTQTAGTEDESSKQLDKRELNGNSHGFHLSQQQGDAAGAP